MIQKDAQHMADVKAMDNRCKEIRVVTPWNNNQITINTGGSVRITHNILKSVPWQMVHLPFSHSPFKDLNSMT